MYVDEIIEKFKTFVELIFFLYHEIKESVILRIA